MISSRLLLAVLAVLSLATFSHAQTFACGGAGYNLSTIGDLNLTVNGYYWSLNPCKPLTTGPCAGTNATFCQSNYDGTTGVPSSGGAVLNYYNPFVNVVKWTSITNGIMSRAINGGQDGCSLGTSVRTGSVLYLCNRNATTAYLSYVEEVEQCQYQAIVQTSLVCASPIAVTSEPVGLPFASNTCGGGLFDLSSIDIRDYAFNDGNGNSFIFRPCSPINSSSNCAAGTSFCQDTYYELSAGNGLAQTYTLQSDGVIIQSQDGQNCGMGGGNFGWPREANVYLQCNASATTPYYVPGSFFEGENNSNEPGGPNSAEICHYSFIIQTAAVCNRITTSGSSNTAVAAVPVPTFSCGGAGYDLTLLSAIDMTYGRGSPYNDVFFVNPCRPLSQGPCAGQGASVCEGNLTSSYPGYTSFVLSYLQQVYAPVQWSATTYNGAQAIQSYSLYGDTSCAGSNTYGVTVVYYCSTSVGSGSYGRISSVVQTSTCLYTIYVGTPLVCSSSPVSITVANTSVGYPFNSNTCGGGLFNLATLDSTDFNFNITTVYTTSTGTASYITPYWWRPCSVAQSYFCPQSSASFCQYGNSTYAYALATPAGMQTNGVAAVNTYTVQPNGLLIQSQDGTMCGNIPRAASTYLVCNNSATSPYLISYSENSGTNNYLNNGQAYCHYELVLGTNQVCNFTLFAAPASSSSSSSSGAAFASSSSSRGSSSAGTYVPPVVASSSAASSSAASSSAPSSSAAVRSSSSSSSSSNYITPSSSSSFSSSSLSYSTGSSTGGIVVIGASSSTATQPAPISTSGASQARAVSAVLLAVLAVMTLLL